MKGAVILAACAVIGLAWVFYQTVLEYFLSNTMVFRGVLVGVLVLVFALIVLCNTFLKSEENNKNQREKIKAQNENISYLKTNLDQASAEKIEMQKQMEALRVHNQTIEFYQKALKKVKNVNRRITRDLKTTRNRLAHEKRERKKLETALHSSPA